MSKLRVHELAKEFNITNRELLEKLIELDVDVKNHMSGVDDETVKVLRGIYKSHKAPAEPVKEAKPEQPKKAKAPAKTEESKPAAKKNE